MTVAASRRTRVIWSAPCAGGTTRSSGGSTPSCASMQEDLDNPFDAIGIDDVRLDEAEDYRPVLTLA